MKLALTKVEKNYAFIDFLNLVLLAMRRGVYTFCAQGQVYHTLLSLLLRVLMESACRSFYSGRQITLKIKMRPSIPYPSFSTRQHTRELKFSPVSEATNFISLIKQSCSSKSQLLAIHARLMRSAVIDDPSISSAFISRSVSCSSDMNYCFLVFDQLKDPNIIHYNALMKGFAQSISPETALFIYKEMRRRGINGNRFSSSFFLKSCSRIPSLCGGKQAHVRILRDGHQSDHHLQTSLMGLYALYGNSSDACQVFDEMLDKDTVAWNVLISCYTRNHRTKDALLLFDLMRSSDYGSKPDDVTCLLLLQACAQLGMLDFGERIRRYAEENGYGDIMNVRNSLLAMYLRCGHVDRAYKLFCETRVRNVVCWSTMISGLAMNGFGNDAIEAFNEMQRSGVAPDEQTFTGVLSACSHSGLVDEGVRFFDMMRMTYRLTPNVCHYGCLVDLFGRAGLLDQAYKLIVHEMGVAPDATIWRTLLGACRIHGHFQLGERVIEHLIELKAQEAGDYVLLLNMYASARNWDKVAHVRKLMKDKGIQTVPGCTTIELNGKVHEFLVDDNSHPRKSEIYDMLEEIVCQLKIDGYVPLFESELHDTGEELKECTLSYHSEKLAVAFGILATPPGTTIRIAKNLRTCADCHNFLKMVSSIYNRVLSVRDRSRFHHFREGHCSCNDYW